MVFLRTGEPFRTTPLSVFNIGRATSDLRMHGRAHSKKIYSPTPKEEDGPTHLSRKRAESIWEELKYE